MLHAGQHEGRQAVSDLRLQLESPARCECIENVSSFVGEDASGSFGILPGHETLVTVLDLGLSRFRVAGKPWQYVAAPGAVVLLRGDELHFATRRYLRGDDYETIRASLQKQISEEEVSLQAIKTSLRGLEQEMLKRLWKLGRREERGA
jgi:F-type H+-transporting ATPase subunit epsilon